MRYFKFILAGLCIYGVFRFFNKTHSEIQFAPSVAYKDVLGHERRLGQANKVGVIGFWISPCGYSDRMLKILKSVRSEYSDNDLEVIGFYLNPTSDEAILNLKPQSEYPFVFAAAQQRYDLIAKLHRSFGIRGGGADVYIVDRLGQIHVVDISDKNASREELLKDVVSALSKNVPDLLAKTSTSLSREPSSTK